MSLERQRTEGITGRDIKIYGPGPVGEKASQLIDKTQALKEMGFHVPKRTILAQGFFDEFFQRNGLGSSLTNVLSEGIPDLVRDGGFTQEGFNLIKGISASYGDTPLAIRSSATGDSRGTGIYHSEFTINQPGQVRKALQKVLSSYFSEDAGAFRRDSGSGEGFGVVVEPLIGHKFRGDMIAPLLSGFGYTSTSQGEGYVNIVPGLGGGVESKDGEKISRSFLAPTEDDIFSPLFEYARKQKHKMVHGEIPMRRSGFLQTNSDRFSTGYEYEAKMFFLGNRWIRPQVLDATMHMDWEKDRNMIMGLMDLDIFPLFDRMDKMEEKFGKPQYFEWAMTLDKRKKPIFWILQISDVDKKLDHMDFEDYGTSLLEGHTVTGTGIKDCDKIVYCPGMWALDSLAEFNQENRGYLLVYSSLASTHSYNDSRTLHYRHFSNAGVLMENQDAQHAFDAGNPLGHIHGQVDMTNKLFGVIDEKAFTEDAEPDFFHGTGTKTEGDLTIYDRKVKVVASERQNRIVVYDRENATDQA